ncbi:hypothetical protein ACRALDRAFT_207530, partial [Sodiomyces alcalophilus JCM 7366]|uniref:uncharacterized protein n=1 Tax=Sodiomyces alcalophilus JCM 7366 TaxID=591952 RepID=UPI0039B61431
NRILVNGGIGLNPRHQPEDGQLLTCVSMANGPQLGMMDHGSFLQKGRKRGACGLGQSTRSFARFLGKGLLLVFLFFSLPSLTVGLPEGGGVQASRRNAVDTD